MSDTDGIGVGITGLAAFLPEHVRTNEFWGDDWLKAHVGRQRRDITTSVDQAVRQAAADVDMEVARASSRVAADPFRGTRERRVIDPSWKSSDMEAEACRRAMADAGVSIEDVDCLLSHSTVPDEVTPQNHAVLSQKLGLRRDATAFTVTAGCASFMAQLSTACRLVQAGEFETVLIVVGCAGSLVTDYDTPSSVNVGDGAVAAVIQRVDDGYGFVARHQCTRGDMHAGICIGPQEETQVPWYRSDELRSRIVVKVVDTEAAHEMGAHAASLCAEVCNKVMAKVGVGPDDVDFFVTAQATAWFGDALSSAVGIDAGRRVAVEEHFAKYGHLLPASAPLNLLLAESSGRLKPGDLVLIYSPGVGFIQSAILFRWHRPTRRREVA